MMTTVPTLKQLRLLLSTIRADYSSIGWSERRAIPATAASIIEAKASAPQVAVAGDLLGLLAGDPKWEVRKAVADALRSIPDESYGGILARLVDDENSFVRQSALSAVERRRKTPVAGRRRQNGPPVSEQLAAFERRYGVQAAQMARSIGESYYDQLVGATAHDVRGILTPLTPQIDRLIGQAESGKLSQGRARRTLEGIRNRLALLEQLVRDMRDYSLPVRYDRRPERLHQIVIEAIALAREEMNARGVDLNPIEISIQVDPNWTVSVARERFLMAVVNVIKNALEAVTAPDTTGPRIEITASSAEDVIRLLIRDSGPGIEVADLADLRQFLPGRKTKKADGTGFGLPIAHRIISGHGGCIEIESELGKGTTVCLSLPRQGQGGDA